MTALYENAYGKNDEEGYKKKTELFPIAKLDGLTKLGTVQYSYFVDDVEKYAVIHLQNALRSFLDKFCQTKSPRTAPTKKLPRLTVADNILILE